MAASAPIVAGSNLIIVEDEVIVWVCGHEVRVDDIRRGHEVFDAVIVRQGYVLILGRIGKLGSLEAEVRRAHNEWHRAQNPYFSVALIEGGVVARTLVRLVLTAAQLVTRDGRTKFDYFNTEAEARDWLHKESARLHALTHASAPPGQSKN